MSIVVLVPSVMGMSMADADAGVVLEFELSGLGCLAEEDMLVD